MSVRSIIESVLLLILKISGEAAHVFGGTKRSPQWAKVRDEFIKNNPICSGCDSMVKIEAHHIVPFHIDPSKELDQSNLIGLCRECHFQLGHLRSWSLHNPTVKDDAMEYKRKYLSARLKS